MKQNTLHEDLRDIVVENGDTYTNEELFGAIMATIRLHDISIDNPRNALFAQSSTTKLGLLRRVCCCCCITRRSCSLIVMFWLLVFFMMFLVSLIRAIIA